MSKLKENLKDILEHTYALGFLDFVKLEGNTVKALSEDKSVLLRGKLNEEMDELNGQKVGMANMRILDGLLKFPLFQDKDASVSIIPATTREGISYPRDVIFTSPTKHTATYTFMSAANADKKVKIPKLAEENYCIEFNITEQNVSDLKYFAGMLAGTNKIFKLSLYHGDVEFHLGDENTCQTIIPIASGVKGTLTADGMLFPLPQVLSILRLSNTDKCKIGIIDGIGMTITITSDYGVYSYNLQARKKK